MCENHLWPNHFLALSSLLVLVVQNNPWYVTPCKTENCRFNILDFVQNKEDLNFFPPSF